MTNQDEITTKLAEQIEGWLLQASREERKQSSAEYIFQDLLVVAERLAARLQPLLGQCAVHDETRVDHLVVTANEGSPDGWETSELLAEGLKAQERVRELEATLRDIRDMAKVHKVPVAQRITERAKAALEGTQ